MLYTNLDDTVQAVIDKILNSRETRINLHVIPDILRDVSLSRSIYEAYPRLLLSVKNIQLSSEFMGTWANVNLQVEYSDIMPTSVSLISSPDEVPDLVLQAASLHRRNVFLVYESSLHSAVSAKVSEQLDSYKILNCFVNSFQTETKVLSEAGLSGIILTIGYSCTYREWVERQQRMKAEIDRIVQEARSAGIEDWRKAQAVIRYCVNNWSYGTCSEPGLEYTSYAALIEKKAVCMGFSLAVCQIFKELGIPCRYVHGTRRGEGHGWNLVYIKQGWFYIDVTDMICRKDPLYHWGMTILEDRTLDTGIRIPEKLVCNCK